MDFLKYVIPNDKDRYKLIKYLSSSLEMKNEIFIITYNKYDLNVNYLRKSIIKSFDKYCMFDEKDIKYGKKIYINYLSNNKFNHDIDKIFMNNEINILYFIEQNEISKNEEIELIKNNNYIKLPTLKKYDSLDFDMFSDVFMSYLVQCHSGKIDINFNEEEINEEEQKKIPNQNKIISNYIKTKLIESDGDNLHSKTIYKHFINWCTSKYNNDLNIDKSILLDKLKEHYEFGKVLAPNDEKNGKKTSSSGFKNIAFND
jgi:hypothetical protein